MFEPPLIKKSNQEILRGGARYPSFINEETKNYSYRYTIIVVMI